jgi:hypothetical protein
VGIKIADAAFYADGANNAFRNVGQWVERNRPPPTIGSVTPVGDGRQFQFAWDRGFPTAGEGSVRFTVFGQTPSSGVSFIPLQHVDATVDNAGHANGSVILPLIANCVRIGVGEIYVFPPNVAPDSTPVSEEWTAPIATDLQITITRQMGVTHRFLYEVQVQNLGPGDATGAGVVIVLPASQTGAPVFDTGSSVPLGAGQHGWRFDLPAQGAAHWRIEADPDEANFVVAASIVTVDQMEGPKENNTAENIQAASSAANFGAPQRYGDQVTFGLNAPEGTMHMVEQTFAFGVPTLWNPLGIFPAGANITLPIDPNHPQTFVRSTSQPGHNRMGTGRVGVL